MEETLRLQLLDLADRFARATGSTLPTIGKQALNDNTFFGRLANPKLSFNVRTYDRVVKWFSERWPGDAEWPASILRPATERVAA